MVLRIVAVVLSYAVTMAAAAAQVRYDDSGPVWVGRFDAGVGEWRELRLKPDLAPNVFTLREWDGLAAVEVRSERSLSMLARPIAVDLVATPVLCWRWRVDAPLRSADMTRRAGDDFAARLYVGLALPEAGMSALERAQLRLARAIYGNAVPDAALNYVWDNRQPVGTVRPNAYTERTTMIVLRSGGAHAGAWVQERRDLGADIERQRGPGARAVQLALAADTDNTGESARAGFAELHFVARDAPCARAGARRRRGIRRTLHRPGCNPGAGSTV